MGPPATSVDNHSAESSILSLECNPDLSARSQVVCMSRLTLFSGDEKTSIVDFQLLVLIVLILSGLVASGIAFLSFYMELSAQLQAIERAASSHISTISKSPLRKWARNPTAPFKVHASANWLSKSSEGNLSPDCNQLVRIKIEVRNIIPRQHRCCGKGVRLLGPFHASVATRFNLATQRQPLH